MPLCPAPITIASYVALLRLPLLLLLLATAYFFFHSGS
jgi:hypothetical protein